MEQSKEQQFAEFVTKIEEAKRKGEEAVLSLYAVCLEFEQSEVWRVSNMPFLKLLATKGISTAKYIVYKAAITHLGDASPRSLGLPALGEIMRLLRVRVEGGDLTARTTMVELYRISLERFSLFQAGHKTAPSATHAVAIVREEAGKLGIATEVAHKPSVASELAKVKAKLDKAVATLEQIADLSQEHAKAAPTIAAATLERLDVAKVKLAS